MKIKLLLHRVLNAIGCDRLDTIKIVEEPTQVEDSWIYKSKVTAVTYRLFFIKVYTKNVSQH
jgi:hypothetical protein